MESSSDEGRRSPSLPTYEEAALLRVIFEMSVDGILTIDEAGVIISANPAVERMFGYCPTELVGQNVKMLMPEPYEAEHDVYLRNYRNTGIRKIIGIGREVAGRRKNGEVFPLELAISETITPAGRIFTGNLRDISERKQSEEVRSRLAALVESSDDAIVSKTLDGVITTWNHGAERMFGYHAHEAIGQSISILIPEDREDEEPALLMRIRNGERVKHYETVRKRKDGSLLHVSLTLSPILDASGLIIGASKIARDITESKRIEEVNRLAHGQLNHLLDNSPAVLYALHVRGDIVEPYMVSRNVTELLGYEVADVKSPSWWWNTVHPEDRDRAFEKTKNTLSSGSSRCEYRLRHKDGSYRYVEDKERLTERSADRPDEIVGVWMDITERKEIERALQKSEERFAEMLENVELIAIIVDTTARVTFCNDYLLRISGWSREEVMGVEWFSMFYPDSDRALGRKRFLALQEKGTALHSESQLRTKSGEYREIHWNTIVLRDASGNRVGVASLGEDVTERNRATAALKEALAETERRVDERTAALAKANADLLVAIQQADKANRAKSEFLSRMSHELRTPLNSVLGYAQLMNLQYDDPRIKASAKAIVGSGQHLLSMINEVLDLSRIESGELPISLEPVGIAEVLFQAFGLVRPMAEARGISLLITGASCQTLHVRADRQRLLQVMINLLGNAIKYNREGGQVVVDCTKSDEPRSRIEVSDTGYGIASSDQELLFLPFQRFGDPGIEGSMSRF